MALWVGYNDKMSENNPKKFRREERGICLLANIFRRALETVSHIRADRISSDDAVAMINDRIYKRDSL